ncbi:hypothetical protein CRU94_08460 [Arcobacter sp. AHV-9/2010]|uniref:hemagglutinin repeat-containing protein n=1 Tax=Arcobacter sp. AHV-9/2010 TaxID=2021861 RepID=UPI00100BA255|nr:hemagglutinin repeat-containing protein [Arcobacter sp. CECT 9299]RXJ94476.1 hypothetical protein CRU94_08460 [Arcobacter sp. CECT 9299]
MSINPIVNKNLLLNLKARESIVLDSLSDINIVGSNLESEENITLSSTVGDVNILSSTDSYSQNIDEKHGSVKISLTLQNEYVEIAQAVDSAVKSAEQLKQTKEDYSNYKSEVKKLENTLSELKQSYKNKEVGVDYSDIEDLSDFIDNLKSQEKYYLAAIASATADLASKTTAIATQTATAAASSGTLGFSAGVSLDVDGSKTNTQNKTTSSNASNLVSNSITINAKEDTNIEGSNLVANDSLNINTNKLNVKASQDTTQNSESLNGSVNLTMYGGGGGTASLGGGKQSFQSNSVINNNSQLLANNVNIDVRNDANLIGASLRAEDTLNLNVGNNLIVESLRDEYSSNQSGFNVNAGMGANTTNAGLSMNNKVSQSKQTVLSSITGNEININVANNTHLKGSLISSDEDNLNLTTDTLTFANLSNSSYSSSKTLGGSVSSNVKGDVSNLGYNSENSLETNASKTLATLGTGNIIIKDKDNSDDITKLNQDTDAINKDLYSSQTGTKVDATLDTRLLTEDGRKEIKDDIYTASAITKAIEQITSNDKVGIKDFFDETQQNVDVYNAMKTKIANSEELSKYLQDPNLDPLTKQNMLQEIASTVMQELGYKSNEVKIISTDETGANNTQVKGYYDSNTQTSYVNDKNNNSTSELVSSTGHEIMHDMDKQKEIFISNDKDQNIYATNFGNNLAYYVNGALYIVNGGNLASTNNHNLGIVTEYPSVFNTNNLLTGNNKEFAGLDKNNGDDLPIIPIVILGVSAFQTYLNTPTNENDIHRGIEGEIDKNMNQPMKKVINKSGEVINLFGNDLNTLYVKRDEISQDISTAYNNMPDWAKELTIIPAMSIVEYGATGWLPKPILNTYDIYSGQIFDTIPISKWGWLGKVNDLLIKEEQNKGNTNGK